MRSYVDCNSIGLVTLLEEEIWTQTCIHTEKRQCENKGRKQLPTSQGERLQNEINPADTLILDS